VRFLAWGELDSSDNDIDPLAIQAADELALTEATLTRTLGKAAALRARRHVLKGTLPAARPSRLLACSG
jgi:hypothetical protein